MTISETMRLTHLERQSPRAPASTELSAVELEAMRGLRSPDAPLGARTTLAEAVRWLAEFGGYTGP